MCESVWICVKCTKILENHEILGFSGKLHEEVQRAGAFESQGIRHCDTTEILKSLTFTRIMREIHTELRDVSFSTKTT